VPRKEISCPLRCHLHLLDLVGPDPQVPDRESIPKSLPDLEKTLAVLSVPQVFGFG
jgi:hypothetical protein